MKIGHVLLAVLVAAIWGLSFIVVKIGLTECPPLLLAALRFVVVFAAGAWWFSRPSLPWRWYLRAGLCLGVIQFACLFSAIKAGHAGRHRVGAGPVAGVHHFAAGQPIAGRDAIQVAKGGDGAGAAGRAAIGLRSLS
ncbi:EamA family transporter [Chromobacterium haemolyticum]|nr:EamA family transporter [Chromobacterium haemolyticum]